MAFIVVYDACVLHPAPLRDLLLRLAGMGSFRAKWTDKILDECFASILRERPDLSAERLRRTRERMVEAVPDCLVRAYEPFTRTLELPDPGDRHVLAAAIRAGAQTIVTFNQRDFPEAVLAPFGIVSQHPDEFLLHLLDLSPLGFLQVLREQAAALRRPPMSVSDVLARLEALGLGRLVPEIRRLLAHRRPRRPRGATTG